MTQMQKTMNEITRITYEEGFYNPEAGKVTLRSYVEFGRDGIETYSKVYGSSKKHDLIRKEIPEGEMKSFFADVYEFVRTADFCAEELDDCSRVITIEYSDCHREIIEGGAYRGRESLSARLWNFGEKHGAITE